MSFPTWQLSDFAVGLTGKCKEGLEHSVPAVVKHSL